MSIRQAGKKGNHALDYDMKYRRFALENEMPESEAKILVDHYHKKAYPGIKKWHEVEKNQLNENRTLVNCFGRKRIFRDAWGPELFDAAFAFKPQSTVYDICRRGMKKTWDDTTPAFRDDHIQLRAHVHDSNMYQFDFDDLLLFADSAVKIGLDYMNPTLEYNAQEFQIGTTMKIGLDWSSKGMHDCPLSEDIEETARHITEVMERLE